MSIDPQVSVSVSLAALDARLTATEAAGPGFAVQPVISGQPNTGQTLTAVSGTIINGLPASRAWLRNGVVIPGATTLSYVLTPEDEGMMIAFREMATNGATTTSSISQPVIAQTAVLVDPIITSAAAVSIPENAPLVHYLTADQSVIWQIVDGSDYAQFEITENNSLRWLNDGVRDFEIPTDTNDDNVYEVILEATNVSGGFAQQTLLITVMNMTEAVPPPVLTHVTLSEIY